MRVLIADTYYDALVARVYRDRPELAGATYAEQRAELLRLRFGTSDAYSHALETLGHEASELVVNCAPLQAAWAREAGLRAPLRLVESGRLRARRLGLVLIAMEQVRAWRPDVLYSQDLWFFPRPALERLRRHVRLLAGQIASPAPGRRILRGYDLIVTSFPHFVPRFRALGVDTEYLPLAFDERVLDALRSRGIDPDARSQRPVGAAFVGGLDGRVHARGTRLLEQAAATELEIWGYGAETLPASSELRRRHRGEAWGLDMYAVLARSRIVLNRHIEAAEGHANNMRLYEATGVGAMLLTDRGANLDELFAVGSELAVYEDEDDLLEKLAHYLAHDDERVAIAAAGQERTLREHTYARRSTRLSELLESRL